MNGKTKNAGTLAAGIGKAIGVGLVVEYKAEVIIRMETKKEDDQD